MGDEHATPEGVALDDAAPDGRCRGHLAGAPVTADFDGVCQTSTAEWAAGYAATRGSRNRRSRVGRKPPPTR